MRKSFLKFRTFADVRMLELLVGTLQLLWATIPLLSIDGSLFSKLLEYSGIGKPWGLLMALSGAFLIFGSIIDRREALHYSQFLSMAVWLSMTFSLAQTAHMLDLPGVYIWTPVTIAMPIACWALFVSLLREMLLNPCYRRDRRRHDVPVENDRRGKRQWQTEQPAS